MNSASLHADNPERVQSLLASGAETTRTAVSALRVEPNAGAASEEALSPSNKLIAQAKALSVNYFYNFGRSLPDRFLT